MKALIWLIAITIIAVVYAAMAYGLTWAWNETMVPYAHLPPATPLRAFAFWCLLSITGRALFGRGRSARDDR